MSWKTRYKNIYSTSDKNLIITAVQSFPNLYDTVEKSNEYYEIENVNKDLLYRDLLSFYYLMNGNDFIPIAFEDKCPRLKNLANINPIGKSFFWCIGYISPYLTNGISGIRGTNGKKISIPDFEILVNWLDYHIKNYVSDKHSTINQFLFKQALIKYVNEYLEKNIITKNKIDNGRLFDLIYNKKTVINFNNELKVEHWVEYLQDLTYRDIYEIIVNDFR